MLLLLNDTLVNNDSILVMIAVYLSLVNLFLLILLYLEIPRYINLFIQLTNHNNSAF
jgi:hypothetical protein